MSTTDASLLPFEAMSPLQRRLHNAAIVLEAEGNTCGFPALLRECIAALTQQAPAAEPVALWQYRWTNPGNKIDVTEDDLAWREVKPWNPHMQSLEQRVEELRGFEFQGVPAYEVRALYAAPQPPQPTAEPVADRLDDLADE